MDRTDRLSPLGLQRLRLLDCLGGNNPLAPGYFEPAEDSDIFAAFRRHIIDLSQRWSTEADPLVVSLLAAARVLTGDLAAADAVLDSLAKEEIRLDHGAGICLVAPVYALKAALPLPSNLGDTTRWLAGSEERTALGAWLTEHREKLRWVETAGVYQQVA